MHTLEYFSSYIAVHALTLTDEKLKLPSSVILFGGGWKNPVVRESFDALINQTGYVLPEHQKAFKNFFDRFDAPIQVKYSDFGTMMEARLFADLARYKLENKCWEIPEVVEAGKNIVCGVVAKHQKIKTVYSDMLNLAAKGWQNET